MKTRISSLVMSLGLSTLAIGPAPARAEIKTESFSGKILLQENRKSNVRVFIRTNPLKEGAAGVDAAFGLILFTDGSDRDRGGLFRIEELPDGTQSWIRLYQGGGQYVRANTEQTPALKGVVTQLDQGSRLRLVPAEGSKLCQGQGEGRFRAISVESDSDEDWIEFPSRDLQFSEGDRGSRGTLKNGGFSGTLVFEDSAHEGSFAFGSLGSGLSVVRAQKLDPQSISGWSLSREILGVAAALSFRGIFGGRGIELVLIQLPLNEENCTDTTVKLRSK